MPGGDKKVYSSLGSVIILVIVRSFRSIKIPHIEFKQRMARPRFAALNLIHPIQSYDFALPERFYITILVLGASNPAGITTSFSFQFEERINLFHEKTTFACFGVLLGHLILVCLMGLEYPYPFWTTNLTSSTNQVRVRAPSPTSVCVHYTLGCVNAYSTQAEHEFIRTPEGKYGMV